LETFSTFSKGSGYYAINSKKHSWSYLALSLKITRTRYGKYGHMTRTIVCLGMHQYGYCASAVWDSPMLLLLHYMGALFKNFPSITFSV